MSPKIRRNQTCPCGSKLKYKKCCGRLTAPEETNAAFDASISARHAADERIREEQQGLGKPIIAAKFNGHQVVAVGKTLFFSPKWKTVPDFLCDYLKRILDPAWGNAELAKPFDERHPIIQWYDILCRHQQSRIKTPGVPVVSAVTGIVGCYVGLAYSLYLLDHNVELQERLVRRLKNLDQFQGAYYELIVANILIRAGFELAIEDETDGNSKHCEFSARSKRTGRKYWVEAKMRVVPGLLGATGTPGARVHNPLSRLVPQLNDALAKPAADERLIFIDLNAEATAEGVGKPPWIERAATRLEQYERSELPTGKRAYVFVTNFPFHRQLNDTASMAAFPIGVGIPDFNRPGVKRVSDAYRQKQRHIDAHYIGKALAEYLKFPATFDGSLPSEAISGSPPRIKIGETYRFGDPANGGVIGTVTTAAVDEQRSQALIGITDRNGGGRLLAEPMSLEQLADYRAHKDSYFGRILPVGGTANDPFELFEWFVDNHRWMSRSQLLEKLAYVPSPTARNAMSDDDLLYEYCELMVAAMPFPNQPIKPRSSRAHPNG
jgi:hypothetical protein